MVLDWKTFSVSEWAGMTADQWATFEIDPVDRGLRYYVEAATVYSAGAQAGAVHSAPHKGYFRHQCEYIPWGTKGVSKAATHGRRERGEDPACGRRVTASLPSEGPRRLRFMGRRGFLVNCEQPPPCASESSTASSATTSTTPRR